MAGIYIHIPFCRKKCSYCNFHFSTLLNNKHNLLQAIYKELLLKKDFINDNIETIYIGGGTPSILELDEICKLLDLIIYNYKISSLKEITLEMNPEDINLEKIKNLKKYTFINRLSIGIQAYINKDLKFMNRYHSIKTSETSIKLSQDVGFTNINVDIIYGLYSKTIYLKKLLNKLIDFNIQHISAYALTVEKKTFLYKLIKNKILKNIDFNKQNKEYNLVRNFLLKKKFIQYEVSNYSKNGYFSKHNIGYWLGNKYIGIGPSAHSFNGDKRYWNISNNKLYYNSVIYENKIPHEYEILSIEDKYNEQMMTQLRTIYGVNLIDLKNIYPQYLIKHLYLEINKGIKKGCIIVDNNNLRINEKYFFLADGIISNFFYIKNDKYD